MDYQKQQNNNQGQTTQNSVNLTNQISLINKRLLKLPKILQQSFSNTINLITNLKSQSLHQQKNDILNSLFHTIKIATQPQINSFKFDKGFNSNPYPIFGIIAFKNQQYGYPMIDWRLCSFIQSCGVRCIPIIQTDLNEQKNINHLKNQIENIHGLIIPQFYQQNSIYFIQKLYDILKKNQKNIAVLSFGLSSNFLLNKIYQNIIKITKNKLVIIQGTIVGSSNSQLFLDLQLILKLKIISSTFNYIVKYIPTVNFDELNKLSGSVTIQAYLIKNQKNSQILPFLFKQKIASNVQMYHCFIQIYDQSCTTSLNYFNKAIVNLVDLSKKVQSNVKNPLKYVAHYPLQFKQSAQKAHYKITLSK